MRACFATLFLAAVLVTWWANPETDISGYNVYIDGTLCTNVGNQTNYIIAGVEPCRAYTVQVSAVNYSGLESELSERLTFVVGGLSYSTNLVDWTTQSNSLFTLYPFHHSGRCFFVKCR